MSDGNAWTEDERGLPNEPPSQTKLAAWLADAEDDDEIAIEVKMDHQPIPQVMFFTAGDLREAGL